MAIETATTGLPHGLTSPHFSLHGLLDLHRELYPLVLVHLVVVAVCVPIGQVVVHHDDLGQPHCLRVIHELLIGLVLRPVDRESFFRLIRALIQVGPGFIRSEIELVLRGLRIRLEMLLVRHLRVLLLWVWLWRLTISSQLIVPG